MSRNIDVRKKKEGEMDNKIIQGLWIGKALSLMEQLSIKSFLAHGHDYHLYVYDQVRNVPAGCTIKDANEVLPAGQIFVYKRGSSKGSYAAFANLFRFKLLLEKGGIWSDLDVVCLKPFDFREPCLFSSEFDSNKKVRLNNTIIKVPVNSQIMSDCYLDAKGLDREKLVWRQSGSDLIEKYVYQYKMESFIFSPDIFCPVNWWEWQEFLNNGFDADIIKKSYAIHLWHEMWRTLRLRNKIRRFIKGQGLTNKNALYNPRTLYGHLQKMYL
ncbi:MAG: hypothetical protein HQL18_01005 [Candidatus Omnitrophica bacterium]|nr:hypothetical protein [Candidatus Omnitrophota bacterium]